MVNQQNMVQQPGIIRAYKQGYQTVSQKLYLILFPLLLDFIFLFGPKLTLIKLFKKILGALSLPQMAEQFQSTWQQWTEQIQSSLMQFNLMSALHTKPIGVPSLFSNRILEKSLLGKQITIDIQSITQIILVFILLSILGIVFATWFYKSVARSTEQKNLPVSCNQFAKNVLHFIALPILLFSAVLVLSLPGMFIISLAAFFLPVIGSVLYMALFIFIISIILPFVFTPHSIVISEKPFLKSLAQSRLVVGATRTKTAFFILVSIGIVYLSNTLWNLPKDGSWMLLVGALGHALVSTTVLVASFHFFKDAQAYVEKLSEIKVEPINLA